MNDWVLSIYEVLGALTLFGVLYAFIDAWHDEKVIQKETGMWHIVDALMKGFVKISLVTLLFVKVDFKTSGIMLILLFLYLVLIRANTFDILLNKLRMMKLSHRGKNPIDQIHWLIKLLLLVANLVVIMLIFEKQ